MEQLLNQGIFEPKATPEQTAALERLETLLALIEGWVQTVVTDALGDRIPGTSALSETLRRRRATGGPAEQTFATLVGLELRPRKLREAAVLWERLTQAVGADARDGVWQHPDLLPELRRPRRARRLHRPDDRRRHQRHRSRRSPTWRRAPTTARTDDRHGLRPVDNSSVAAAGAWQSRRMTGQAAHRSTLDPAMPVLLRPDGAVQVGWDPRRAVLVHPPQGLTAAALADLLRTMQSGATMADLQAEAVRRGVADAALRGRAGRGAGATPVS